MLLTVEILRHAKILYDFQRVDNALEKSDLIFVLCSHDLRVADYAARLMLDGYGKKILFSGGIAHQGDLLATGWQKAEAKIFAERAIQIGVDPKNIICETKSTNTGENIIFSQKIIQEQNILSEDIILVQKPYMQLRGLATFKKQYSLEYKNLIVSAPDINFKNYANQDISIETVIHILVGNIQRLMEYSKLGFQIEVDIPQHILDSYNLLVNSGYSKHVSKK